MKQCFKCKNQKPLEHFYAHPQMADGRLGKCKECARTDVIVNRAAKLKYYRDYEKKRNATPARVLRRALYIKTDSGKKSKKKAGTKYQKTIRGRWNSLVGNNKRRQCTISITFEQYVAKVSSNQCYYCTIFQHKDGTLPEQGYGLDRKNSAVRDYSNTNTVPSCSYHNTMKGGYLTFDEMVHILGERRGEYEANHQSNARGTKMKLIINSQNYTKAQVEKRLREILYSPAMTEPCMLEITTEDTNFIKQYIACGERADLVLTKIHVKWWKQKPWFNLSPAFVFTHESGQRESVSYKHLLLSAEQEITKTRIAEMRDYVRNHTRCPEGMVMHHVTPFNQLVKDFWRDRNDTTSPSPGWEKEWTAFHKQFAVLKPVTPEEHKSIHKGGKTCP